MLDDQFFSSPSWLPSPRFELRTLAGYSTNSQNSVLLLGQYRTVREPDFSYTDANALSFVAIPVGDVNTSVWSARRIGDRHGYVFNILPISFSFSQLPRVLCVFSCCPEETCLQNDVGCYLPWQCAQHVSLRRRYTPNRQLDVTSQNFANL